MRYQFPPLTPTVRTLLIVLGITFLGQTLVEGLLRVPITQWAALWSGAHVELAWQWATHWLIAGIQQPNDVVWHLVSLLVLYMLLSPFESQYGARRVVQLAAAGIVAGTLPVILVGLVFPSLVGPVLGPGGISWAWMGAFAVLNRDGKIGVLFLPTEAMSAWTMVGIFLGISALGAAWQHDAADLLHALGALGGGVLYGRWLLRPSSGRGSGRPLKKKPTGRPNLTVIDGGADDKPRWLN